MSVAAVSNVAPVTTVHRPDVELAAALRPTSEAEAKVRDAKPHEVQSSNKSAKTPDRNKHKVDVTV